MRGRTTWLQKDGSWCALLRPDAPPYDPDAPAPARAPHPRCRGQALLPKFPPGPYRSHREAHGCWPGPCEERQRLFKAGREAGVL